MKTKLLIAAAIAALSFGAGVAQADSTKSDAAITEAKFGLYINVNPYPYYYYRPYYYQPYYYNYYQPYCFYNYWGNYVCR